MKRDQQQYQDEVEEHLRWHEQKRLEYLRERKAKEPAFQTWSPQDLTPEQQAEQDEYIRTNNCPF